MDGRCCSPMVEGQMEMQWKTKWKLGFYMVYRNHIIYGVQVW